MAKSRLLPFIVFYGQEEYLLDREVQKGKAWKNRDVEVLDGRHCTEMDLLNALDNMTLDGSEQAVILDYANKLKVGKLFKEYVECQDLKDTSMILVAVLRTDKIPKSWEPVTAKGRVIEHRRFKPWETQLTHKRLHREAALLDLKLDEKAIALLLKVYGDDTRSIVNELQKLTFITPKGSVVTKDSVRSLCRSQLSIQPWDVSEKAAQKSLKQALAYTALLFKYEGEDVAIPITASLMRQVERLLVVKSMLDQGLDASVIGAALQMKEYAVKKFVVPIARKHQVSELIIQMKMLCKLETQVKGMTPSKRTLVELAVHQLAA